MMYALGTSWIPRHLWFAAGVFSKGSLGNRTLEDGWGTVVLSLLMGAFFGLLVGLMISHVVKFITFLQGRQTSGYGWTIVSMAVGAALFAWWTITNGGDAEAVAPNPHGGGQLDP